MSKGGLGGPVAGQSRRLQRSEVYRTASAPKHVVRALSKPTESPRPVKKY